MANPVQVVAGVVLVFFLPGYTLVNMLFPRKGELDPEYDQVYRIALGMGLSIVIAIMVGFGLNALSSEGHGLVTAGPLWAVLLSTTAIFVFIGWLRGAYPNAGAIHPSLYRAPKIPGMPRSKGSEFVRRKRTERLIMEREMLVADVKRFSDFASTPNPTRKEYYRKRLDYTRSRIDQINEELRSMSGGR